MTDQWWHAYGGISEAMGGCHVTVVLGPTPRGADEPHKEGEVTSFRDLKIPDLGDTPFEYLGSFDHEPSELEKDKITPDEFRTWDDEGNEIPWNEED